MAGKSKTTGTARPGTTATPDDLIRAAMSVAEAEGWCALSMPRIAEEANVDLPTARSVFATVHALLESLSDKTDQSAMRECAHFQDEDTVRDRLFALLMARLEYLAPCKPALRTITPGAMPVLLSLTGGGWRLFVSMALMLQLAGVPPSGPIGVLRTKGLGIVYVSAFRVWLRDDTEDLAATMATMDKGLHRAEMLARQFSLKH